MIKNYTVPAGEYETVIEIKKSRFIARSMSVENREQAMAFLQKVKEEFPDARHHCWAYLIGNPESASNAAMNDDGEPGGTAGKPILNVIQHKKIGDVMIIVIRYFGGIKLGAGGLTRAYSSAADAVLTGLPLKTHVAMLPIWVQCDFSKEQLVRHQISQLEGTIIDTNYSLQVTMALMIPQKNAHAFDEFCLSRQIIVQKESFE